jgi:hypothetical protein
MLKIFRLFSYEGSFADCHKIYVDDFDARTSDKEGDEAKNRQAESDMMAYMEKHKGYYTFQVIFVS